MIDIRRVWWENARQEAFMGTLIYMLGSLVALVGGVIVLIEAFKKSVLWGLLSFCIPFAVFVFVAQNWSNEKVRKGFFIWLAGFGVMIVGVVLGGAKMFTQLRGQ